MTRPTPNYDLPPNWRIQTICTYGGTGNGDDEYGPGLFRWKSVTIGHLWWKKQITTWVLVDKGRSFDLAGFIQYAWDTYEAEQSMPLDLRNEL